LVASAAAAAAGTAAAVAAASVAVADLLLATQASLLKFCNSLLRALVGRQLPCAHMRGGLLQEKSMRWSPAHVSKTTLSMCIVTRHILRQRIIIENSNILANF
jgi:hypothetical protein